MPDIEFRNSAADIGPILAAMHFPENDELRETYAAVHYVDKYLADVPGESCPSLEREALVRIIRVAKSTGIKTQVANAIKRAAIAADFLISMYAMHSFPEHFKKPSVSKAIFIARKFAGISQYGDGTSIPSSESEIRECIKEYRLVAHFWGALRFHASYPIIPNELLLGSLEGTLDFLGIAGTLQDFACTFVPPSPKPGPTLLDAAQIWRVPETIRRLRFPWKTPPSWLVATLKSYKARQRGSI